MSHRVLQTGSKSNETHLFTVLRTTRSIQLRAFTRNPHRPAGRSLSRTYAKAGASKHDAELTGLAAFDSLMDAPFELLAVLCGLPVEGCK